MQKEACYDMGMIWLCPPKVHMLEAWSPQYGSVEVRPLRSGASGGINVVLKGPQLVPLRVN